MIEKIRRAAHNIQPYVFRTPLLYSAWLSEITGGKVYLKMESEQITGSFKARGAANKVLEVKSNSPEHKVITASTGNHGLGVAHACSQIGIHGKVVLPTNVVSTKKEALERSGIAVELMGGDCFESEMYALKQAQQQPLVYISPYNDETVIAGQGTVGLEIMEQLDNQPNNIFVTIGGGGLISGIAHACKGINSNIQIIGCQPEVSAEMTLSVQSGQYTTVPSIPTLSDASAGAFEEDSITYPICKTLVDDFILTSEDEIANGIRLVFEKERKVIEGAAAVAVGALLKNPKKWENQTNVIVICGGNISRDKLVQVLS
jgi:threonine dehydratase